MVLSKLALAIIAITLVQPVNIIQTTNASRIYKTSPILLYPAYAETPQQLQLENVIGDACIPGSLPYVSLIINIIREQRKASLGNPTSNITKILDDSRQENNTIHTGSYEAGTDTTMQNRSNESDAKYYQNFTEGAIYWKRDIGAHEVHGGIYNKWKELGLERGFLGFPVTDEMYTLGKDATLVIFEGGTIYRNSITGTHEIHGSIFDKWKSMGAERSFLGYPITDEMSLSQGRGAIQYFQGGAIMFTKQTGAHAAASKDLSDYFQHNSTQELPLINETSEATTKINKDIALEPIFKGVDLPTSMAFLGPDDILILEKNKGTVKRFVNGSLINEPLLDVNVATRGERGMLGIAVAKDFQGNGSSIITDNDDDLSTNGTKRAGPITNLEQSSSNPTKTYVFLYFTESRTKDTGDVCEELLENEVIGNRLYRYELAPNGTKLINPKLLL